MRSGQVLKKHGMNKELRKGEEKRKEQKREKSKKNLIDEETKDPQGSAVRWARTKRGRTTSKRFIVVLVCRRSTSRTVSIVSLWFERLLPLP